MRAAGAAYHLDRAGEVVAWAERLRDHPREAGVLYYLGQQQNDAGDADEARATHERALAIAQRHGDARAAGRNAFLLYIHARRQGAYAQALTYAHTSLVAARRAGNSTGQRNAMEAIGLVLHHLGDIEGARRALAEQRRLADPADPEVRSRIHQKEGLLLEAEQRLALARDAYARASALDEAAGDQQQQHDNLLNLASVSMDLGDLAAARRYLDALHVIVPDSRAALLYRGRLARLEGRLDQAAELQAQGRARIDDPDWLWEIELEAGRVAELRGDHAAAEAAYTRAIGLIEDMRGNLASNELRAWVLARKRRPYEALFRLHARQGRARAALDALDRAKARSILEAFIAHAEPPAAEDAGDRAEPAGNGAGRDEPLPAWMRRAVDRAGTLAALLPAMSAAPVVRPRSADGAAKPSVDEMIAALGTRTALVYFRIEDALWLVRVSGGHPEPAIDLVALASSAADLDALDALVDTLVRAPGDTEAAEALGRRLLPAALLPAAGTPLYLVADGPLMRLPFAALRIEERYLIERHALVHVPSLGALAAIEAHARPPAARPAVLGDARGDLPDAAREVAHVAALLGVPPRLGSAATAAALREAAGARVLHLATHLEVDARGATLTMADGAVDAAQVVTWRLGPALAVLAGCASAVQLTHRHGREMWGSMAAAFLASGARQVLAALWSIPDGPTRAFIERFYAEGGARDPAAALVRVQRAWIADGRAPELWAPFVLMGTAEPAQDSVASRPGASP